MLRNSRTQRGRERGSIVLAICVVITVTTLAMVVIVRAINAVDIGLASERFDIARQTADAGLAAAVAGVDGLPGGSSATTLSGTGALGDATYTWTANKVSDTQWDFTSNGEFENETIRLTSSATRTSGFPYAIFTNQDLKLDGIAVRSIDSRVSFGSTTGNAVIGSNGRLMVSGSGGGNVQHPFTPHGACFGNSCTNVQFQAGPRNLPDPAPPADAQACPTGGVFGSVIDGAHGLAYHCAMSISFPPGAVTVVNGPAIIYLSGSTNVTIPSGSAVNPGAPAPQLQLLKAGTGTMTVGDGGGPASFFGVFYAPRTSVIVDGGSIDLGGSFTAERLTVPQGFSGEFRYDEAVQSLAASAWVTRDWQQLPA